MKKFWGFGYVFKKHRKFLGHSQNITDTIWIVLGLYFFHGYFMDSILGHRKIKNG
jgi:hypothetical protein